MIWSWSSFIIGAIFGAFGLVVMAIVLVGERDD